MCSSFAKDLLIDPVGSAFHAELVVLIEVPLPWPKPVGDHPLLSNVFALMRTAATPTRILACEPRPGAGETNDSGEAKIQMTMFRFDGFTYVRSDHVVDAGALEEAVAFECAGGNEPVTAPDVGRRSLLVCTQGSHDICCGELGVPFADDVATRYPDVDVFRVSHTGGHRFAPTALSMPDGRMWAFVGADDIDIVLTASGAPVDVKEKCRGWIGAKLGAAQTAERAVFAEVGWEWDNTPRSVLVTQSLDAAAHWDVVVEAGDQRWDLRVAIGREVPTISCSQPGGLPAKPGREYTVLSMNHIS